MRLLALLLLLPSLALAHSVEPGRINVMVIDGHTEYAVTAANWYHKAVEYHMEAYVGDDETRVKHPLSASPEKFILGPLLKRRVWIEVDDLASKYLWICTVSEPGVNSQVMTMATRVCSRATLHYKRERK